MCYHCVVQGNWWKRTELRLSTIKAASSHSQSVIQATKSALRPNSRPAMIDRRETKSMIEVSTAAVGSLTTSKAFGQMSLMLQTADHHSPTRSARGDDPG